MKVNSTTSPAVKTYKSKKEMILWDGGIYFGGFLTSIVLALDLLLGNTERYMPSKSPTSIVVFSWIWALVVNPIFFFVCGCFFGFIMWKLQERLRNRSVSPDNHSDD